MNKLLPALLVLLTAGVFSCSLNKGQISEELEFNDFIKLFDGKTLNGWRKLTEYSGNDGAWKVVEGVIVGDQFPEGKGGLLVTNHKFSDFELYAEVKADYPVDSGLFLRVQPSVLSYQVTIDYRPEGEVGAIYCPTNGDFIVHKPEGMGLWKKGEYNSVRVRIKGQPPSIRVWINDVSLVDYTDILVDGEPRVPPNGYVGIQVHPGPSWGQGKKVYFRRILLKPID